MNMLPPNSRAALLAGLLVTVCSVAALAAAPKAGDAFPILSEAKLEGTLPDTQGKVVLVDFWASWCGPCRAAFPSLKQIAEKYKDRGLVVIGVSLDEDKADMDAFVRKLTPNFTIVRDAKGKLAERLEVQAIPSTFIVDQKGKIAAIHAGFGGEVTAKEYVAEIERLLTAR